MSELYKIDIEIGKQYRHYKNKHVYEIVGEAINAASTKENPETYIVYKDTITQQLFIRRPSNFFESVKDEFGDKILRFDPI